MSAPRIRSVGKG